MLPAADTSLVPASAPAATTAEMRCYLRYPQMLMMYYLHVRNCWRAGSRVRRLIRRLWRLEKAINACGAGSHALAIPPASSALFLCAKYLHTCLTVPSLGFVMFGFSFKFMFDWCLSQTTLATQHIHSPGSDSQARGHRRQVGQVAC